LYLYSIGLALIHMIRGVHTSPLHWDRRAFARTLLGAALAVAAFSPSVSLAQSAESCSAVEQTEAMREQGQFRKARERLLECVNAQCGGDVRRRCATTLQKLDAATPSIVVRATDPVLNDVMDVSVKLGDELLVSSLDGMAIAVDPGEHQFTFTRAGHAPVTQTLTIERGTKFRAIDVVIGEAPTLALPPPRATTADSSAGLSETAVASGTLIGVGVVGLASFVGLGLRARAGEDALERCKPDCSRGRVDSVEKRYLFANVSLGVGLAALGAATWVMLSGSSDAAVAEPADTSFAVGADAQGAFAAYSGRF
jgi:hypothetical protein